MALMYYPVMSNNHNLIVLGFFSVRFDEAISHCESLVNGDNANEEMWIKLAQLHALHKLKDSHQKITEVSFTSFQQGIFPLNLYLSLLVL